MVTRTRRAGRRKTRGGRRTTRGGRRKTRGGRRGKRVRCWRRRRKNGSTYTVCAGSAGQRGVYRRKTSRRKGLRRRR